MNEEKNEKQKRLDNVVKSKIKGLGLDALFHLVDVNQKDAPSSSTDTNTHESDSFIKKLKNKLPSLGPQRGRFNPIAKIAQIYTKEPSSIVGIEINENALKIICVKIENEKPILEDIQYIEIPDFLKTKEDKRQDFITESLKQLKNFYPFKNSLIASVLPKNKVIIKTITLPTENVFEIQNMIEFEAEHHFPFPLNELELDYHINKTINGESEILLVAVKKNAVQSHLDLLAKADLKPQIIDVSSLSLFNFLKSTSSKKGRAIQIHIDYNYIDINIIEQGVLKSTRGIHWGTNKLIEEATSTLNINTQATHKLFCETGIVLTKNVPNETSKNFSDMAKNWAKQIVVEINKTIHHFHLLKGLETTGDIILLGQGATLLNLNEYLKDQLNTNVTIQKPSKDIATKKSSSSYEKYFLHITPLEGLTSRILQNDRIKINLLPKKIKLENKRNTLKIKITMTIALFLITATLLASIPYTILTIRNVGISHLTKEAANLEPQVALLEDLKKKMQTIKDYGSFEHSCMEILREISIIVSMDVIIKSFDFKENNSVTLVGEAQSHTSVVNLSGAVRASKLFKDATLKYTRKKDRSKDTVDFEILCILN
jgi:type IV pilus assembly protein PilM